METGASSPLPVREYESCIVAPRWSARPQWFATFHGGDKVIKVQNESVTDFSDVKKTANALAASAFLDTAETPAE